VVSWDSVKHRFYCILNRLGWAGHVIHMDNNSTVKKVFNTKLIGIRKIGRPKLR
jgi:hypothetical protein